MSHRVQKLDSARKYGVLVTGLQPADLEDAATRAELVNLWIEHGLIVFKGYVSESFHVALSEVFGTLEAHPIAEVRVQGNPVLINVRYEANSGELWEVDGKVKGGWLPWHSDLIYVDRINHGGILRAMTLPSSGGETGFIDRIEAYEALPQTLRERIENLQVVYKLQIDYGAQRYVSRHKVRMLRSSPWIESVRARQERDFSYVVHPAVYTQPQSGRKVLNISPMHAQYIYGMDDPEGHALLRVLIDRASDENLAHYHSWKLDELVLWDNWRMIHSATGCDSQQDRIMQRTTIAGDYALGRNLSDFHKLAV
jgi:taurine dioxygenase